MIRFLPSTTVDSCSSLIHLGRSNRWITKYLFSWSINPDHTRTAAIEEVRKALCRQCNVTFPHCVFPHEANTSETDLLCLAFRRRTNPSLLDWRLDPFTCPASTLFPDRYMIKAEQTLGLLRSSSTDSLVRQLRNVSISSKSWIVRIQRGQCF